MKVKDTGGSEGLGTQCPLPVSPPSCPLSEQRVGSCHPHLTLPPTRCWQFSISTEAELPSAVAGPGRGSFFLPPRPAAQTTGKQWSSPGGGRAEGAAPQRCCRARPRRGQCGRVLARPAPAPASGLFATLSNCRLRGRGGVAAGRAKESWVPATAASGSQGPRRERPHTRSAGELSGDEEARGRRAGPGRSRNRTRAPVLERPEPSPQSGAVALPGSHLRAPRAAPLPASPGPDALRTAFPAMTLRAPSLRRSSPAPRRQADARPLASRGTLSGRPRSAPRWARPPRPLPRRAGANRPGRRPRPTFVRQPLQAEREVPPPAPHPRGRPAARPGLASPAPAPAPAPPPPGPAAQRSAGEGRGPRARRAWAAAEGRGVRAAARRSAQLRSPRLSRRCRRARAFPGAGAGRRARAGAARSETVGYLQLLEPARRASLPLPSPQHVPITLITTN